VAQQSHQTAVPRLIDKFDSLPDLRVMIRNADGNYLANDANGLFFTNDRSRAALFNFQADRVQEQIEIIRRTEGMVLVAEPVPPEEIYETCDKCKELFMPSMTFFDGNRFLCADCRTTRLQSRAQAGIAR
jgi:hypothetical protein